MQTNEFLYAELLELFKKKEMEKEKSLYQPIEMELPIQQIQPETIGDENIVDSEKQDRGITIIELL